MQIKRTGILFLLLLTLAWITLACNLSQSLKTIEQTLAPQMSTLSSDTPIPQVEPGQSPAATPEPLWVDPVTSPTSEDTQDIVVYIGNGEEVTVITESGEFSVLGSFNAYGNPAVVTITLLPDTIHHLKIIARVKSMQNCTGTDCGGYTLETTLDQEGNPLIIVQGEPQMRLPGAVITTVNAADLTLLGTIQPQDGYADDCVFWQNASLLSVGNGKGISIWDPQTGNLERTIGLDSLDGGRTVAVSPDQSLAATGEISQDRVVRIWKMDTGEAMTLGSHDSHVESLAFNPDGSLLASGGNDNLVMVWDTRSGDLLARFEGDVPGFLQTFSGLFWQDSHTLAAFGSHAIYWWDVSTQKLVKRIEKPAEVSFFVDGDFSSDGQQIAAAAQDHFLYLWQADTAEWRTLAADAELDLSNAAFSPDGSLVATGTYDRMILLWNVEEDRLEIQIPVQTDAFSAILFSPDGRYLAAAGWRGPIWLWGIP